MWTVDASENTKEWQRPGCACGRYPQLNAVRAPLAVQLRPLVSSRVLLSQDIVVPSPPSPVQLRARCCRCTTFRRIGHARRDGMRVPFLSVLAEMACAYRFSRL